MKITGKQMNQGWIKLYRKLLDSDMYQSLNSKQRDVMIQVLMKANHEEKTWEWNGKLYTCKPGEFITSLDSLRKACAKDVNTQNIRTALLKLEKWGFLTNESTKTGRLIRIVNWDIYQASEEQANKASNKELTKNQQTANKQLTTNKNDKECKECKEEDNTASGGNGVGDFYLTKKKRKLKGDKLTRFNEFWKAFAYPKGKAAAADSWIDIPGYSDDLACTIISAAMTEAINRQDLIDDGRTPKWAQGWLSDRRWEDEVHNDDSPQSRYSVDDLDQHLANLKKQKEEEGWQ